MEMDRGVQVMFLMELWNLMEKHLPPHEECQAVMKLAGWYQEELQHVRRLHEDEDTQSCG